MGGVNKVWNILDKEFKSKSFIKWQKLTMDTLKTDIFVNKFFLGTPGRILVCSGGLFTNFNHQNFSLKFANFYLFKY
jgi:hypothetical protein